MQLVFATNNKDKIKEIARLLEGKVRLLGLADLGALDDLPENQSTIEGNALEKANFIYRKYRLDCFADDTGLEIEALGGRPGVLSARYAGGGKNPEDNILKVLQDMEGIENRNARFKTVIALIVGGDALLFEGIVQGQILTQKRGSKGFGYDPIFQPRGYGQTFAEMDLDLKNKISHRALAVNKLVNYLLS